MKPVLSIEFCVSWGYGQKAVTALGVLVRLYKKEVSEFKLIPSSGGAFEVKWDEKVIFSKKAEERFPELDELSELVEKEI